MYNITKIYNYNPNIFARVPGSDWEKWRSLYKIINYTVSFIDRTGTIRIPIRTDIPDSLKLPLYDPTFKLSYEECCYNRVMELVGIQDKIDCPIRILYSGGIDSSLVLTSFIEALGLDAAAKRVTVLLDYTSILENPKMWEKFIRPHFKIENSDMYGVTLNSNSIIISGEGNDQLFGTDLYKDIIVWGGKGILYEYWNEGNIKDYLAYKNLTAQEIDMWYSLFLPLIKGAKCTVETVADWWWWINFTCKWSSVFYRMMVNTQNPSQINHNYVANYYQQFYCTPEFQQWSMNDRHNKHMGDYLTYKFYAKNLIVKFLGDNSYVNKVKAPSLSNIIKFKKSADIIDENYKFHYGANPTDWYNPENSFI